MTDESDAAMKRLKSANIRATVASVTLTGSILFGTVLIIPQWTFDDPPVAFWVARWTLRLFGVLFWAAPLVLLYMGWKHD